MQLPGLLIEYLIDGSVALIWLLPILQMLGFPVKKDDAAIIALFVPGLYVLGMIVDSVGFFIVDTSKKSIEVEAYASRKAVHAHEEFKFLVYASELAKAREMHSSRDRIARGTIVNVTLATIVLSIYFWNMSMPWVSISVVGIGLIVIRVCWLIWARFQRLSFRFQIRGWQELNLKLQKDANKS